MWNSSSDTVEPYFVGDLLTPVGRERECDETRYLRRIPTGLNGHPNYRMHLQKATQYRV